MTKFYLGDKRIPLEGFNEFCWKKGFKSLKNLGDYCGISKQRVEQVLKREFVPTWFFSVVRSKSMFDKYTKLEYKFEEGEFTKKYCGNIYGTNLGNILKLEKRLLGDRLVSIFVQKGLGEKSIYRNIDTRNLPTDTNHELVHRIIATLFVDNPEREVCVNHLDGDKHNNHPENLEWCSHKANVQHAISVLGKHGSIK